MGLFMSVITVMLWTLDKKRFDNERVLGAAVLAGALFLSFWYSRSGYRFGKYSVLEDKSPYKQAVDTLLADGEHLYLCKVDPLDKAIYSAFETAPDGPRGSCRRRYPYPSDGSATAERPRAGLCPGGAGRG